MIRAPRTYLADPQRTSHHRRTVPMNAWSVSSRSVNDLLPRRQDERRRVR